MKKLALVLGFVFISFSSIAQNNENVTVTVIIENVLSDEGSIIAGLHTEDTFMKGQGVANAIAQAATGEVTLTFENISKGTYAIMVIHDVNNNKQMDMENGMPTESYGTSGEMNMYGPPSFESSKIELTGIDQTIRIRF